MICPGGASPSRVGVRGVLLAGAAQAGRVYRVLRREIGRADRPPRYAGACVRAAQRHTGAFQRCSAGDSPLS